MHSQEYTLKSNPRSNSIKAPESNLGTVTLAALRRDEHTTHGYNHYSYHMSADVEPHFGKVVSGFNSLSSSSASLCHPTKPLELKHPRYNSVHLPKVSGEDFVELYRSGLVPKGPEAGQMYPLQYHLDTYQSWRGGLKHRSAELPPLTLPSQAGIDAERKAISESSSRRGYDRVSTLSPGRLPTRHLPLVSRPPSYPREQTNASQATVTTSTPRRGVTFYTTGDEEEEEEEKETTPKKKPLYWTPKTFKNLFLPSVPAPKGMESSGYTAGVLQ